jgi:hypothetical protein
LLFLLHLSTLCAFQCCLLQRELSNSSLYLNDQPSPLTIKLSNNIFVVPARSLATNYEDDEVIGFSVRVR